MAKQSFVTGQVLTAQQVNDLQTNDFNQTVNAKTASYTLVAADKGTRITMSSTSATTITVNTGLFAAGDTLFIQNLNTGVCTITPGTATVNTSAALALAQHEGGTLYFTSAGDSTFFKAAGAAAGGGSGLTLIDEVSFSASMGVNVDSVFSTTYNNYKIIGNIKGDSFALDATMKMRVSGTNTSTNYILQSLNSASSTTTSSNNAAATDMLFGEVHTTYSIETYDIVAPFLTQRTSMMGMYGHSSGAMRMTYQAQTDATSFTGFALIFSAAATGTVSVYGYAKE